VRYPSPIQLQGVGVSYDLRLKRKRSIRRSVTQRSRIDAKGHFWALRNIDLEVPDGEMVAVVGGNGAGKSTLLLTLAGIITPDEGSIKVYGNISTLLHVGAGFDDELNAEENILLVGAFLGVPASTMRKKIPEILEFADIGEFARSEVRTYSSGMRARLGFAVATSVNPDVLLIDEVLSTGDASFRDKARNRILELMNRARAVVYVTHDLSSAKEICTRAIELEGGKIIADGSAREVINAYEKKMRIRASSAASANGPNRVASAPSRRSARKG
jgi:ABC-type polysaccharide/polyol phosphate transport system ATPase subunit